MKTNFFIFCSLVLTLGFQSSSKAGSFDLDSFLSHQQGKTTEARITDNALFFIGKPYFSGPLGEGSDGVYDVDPLYRFDGFDCTTFVETVTALSYAKDAADFKSLMNEIRYENGRVSFVTRNHFTDLDWIPNNLSAGFYIDLTEGFSFTFHMAEAVIDKKAWYEKLPDSRLHALGADFKPEVARVPYLSIDELSEKGFELLAKLPTSQINFVRPNWDLVSRIGTHQNISHQGIVLHLTESAQPTLIHASETSMKVVEVSLKDYLAQFIHHPTLKGINLLRFNR